MHNASANRVCLFLFAGTDKILHPFCQFKFPVVPSILPIEKKWAWRQKRVESHSRTRLKTLFHGTRLLKTKPTVGRIFGACGICVFRATIHFSNYVDSRFFIFLSISCKHKSVYFANFMEIGYAKAITYINQ